MYRRSFLTCDDPMGVVYCKMIRKPKTGSEKTERKKIPKAESTSMNESLVYEGRRKKEDQMAFSKGKRIDQFHNRPSSSGQVMGVPRGALKLNRVIASWSSGESKEVAKDLLKGALDLQRSLIVLGELQEASQYMVHLKKKEKPISRRRGGEENLFSGPNLLSDSVTRSLDSGSEISSTSSSQCSVKKLKGTNVIAKLMGLEGIPEKEIPKGENIPKLDSGRRRMFKDFLETMESKRILRYHYHDLERKMVDFDRARPIVLIKPIRVLPNRYESPLFGEVVEEKEEEGLNSRKMIRKSKMKEESRDLSFKKVHRKLDSEEKMTIKSRTSTPHKNLKPDLKEGMEKEAPKSKKVNMENNIKDPLENEMEKGRIVTRSKNQEKTTPKKARNPGSESNVVQNQNPQQKLSSLKKNQEKKEEVVKEPLSVNLVTHSFQAVQEEKRPEITTESTNHPPDLHPQISGSEEASCDSIDRFTEDSSEIFNRNGNDLKTLLLSSPLFVTKAEELFDVKNSSCGYDIKIPRTPILSLSLDCAIELMERKCHQGSRLRKPDRIRVCLHKLVEEICDGIESLESYNGEVCSESEKCFRVEGFYLMMERDMKCRGMENGIWELGWEKEHSVKEIEDVVNEIGRVILCGLIEEMSLFFKRLV